MKWICSKCKGSNIEVKAWIDANTQQVLDDTGIEDDTWCRDCEEHTEFELVEDDVNQLKLEL